MEADDEIMIMTEEGVVVRTPVDGISELGRSTQGVRVMNVADDDRVTAIAISTESKKDEDSEGETEEQAEQSQETQEPNEAAEQE